MERDSCVSRTKDGKKEIGVWKRDMKKNVKRDMKRDMERGVERHKI